MAKAKYNSKNPRYWSMDLDKKNVSDLNKWIEEEKLEGLVDEEEGGIIGYVNPLFTKDVVNALNKVKADTNSLVINKTDLVKDFKKVLERLESERKKLMLDDFAESFGIKKK